MVVLHRTTVTVVMILLRFAGNMVLLTARIRHLAAFTGGGAIQRENAGIQASEDAENQKPCEEKSHQWAQTPRHCTEFQGKFHDGSQPHESWHRTLLQPKRPSCPLHLVSAEWQFARNFVDTAGWIGP